jgi:penicillin-binding protein 2
MFGRKEKISPSKLTVVQYVTLVVFLVLAYGLWSLQVRKSGEYETRAEQNRVRRVPILAPRGKILDREGRIIVDNYPSFSALLLRDQARDLNADAEKIAQGLNIPADEIREKVRRLQLAHTPAFQPIIIKDDITPDERAFIESHKDEFPELETIMVHRRLYPKNGFMAHLIGYVGEVSEDMLNSPKFDLYERGDIVGQSGVEQSYNDLLMGKNGSRRVLVDSKGREKGKLSEDPAVVGKQLKLTVDLDIQIAAEQALEGKNGAVVAMDPRTGEILAMASRPTFDPNDFAIRISREEWNRLITDPAHPLLNKAIQAQLAPGSVFKIIMSTAGLQEGIAQNLHVNCNGGGNFYGRYFKCWVLSEHRTHGAVDISKAIYQSCDVFFYTLAQRLGIERIAKWASAFGLGKKTGIDLPNEVSGTMPSEEWKIKNYRQKWIISETISVGIGQGAVTTTPIQLAHAIGGISMAGALYRPHVVAPDQLTPQFKQVAGGDYSATHVPLDPQNWITITDAMAGVVNPGGTAPSAHLQGIDFAGKTGSAQVISNDLRKSKGGSGKEFKDNGWFAGVAPRRNPEIVVAVLIEQGEHGYLAARMAAQVIKAYVDKQRRLHNNPTLFSDKADPGSVPVAGVWSSPQTNDGAADGHNHETDGDQHHLLSGTLLVKTGKQDQSVWRRSSRALTSVLPETHR